MSKFRSRRSTLSRFPPLKIFGIPHPASIFPLIPHPTYVGPITEQDISIAIISGINSREEFVVTSISLRKVQLKRARHSQEASLLPIENKDTKIDPSDPSMNKTHLTASSN